MSSSRDTEPRSTETAIDADVYRVAMEHLDEIVYKVLAVPGQRDGSVQFVSGRFSAIIGHDPQDLVRDPTYWIRLVHPDDLPGIIGTTARLVAKPKRTRGISACATV